MIISTDNTGGCDWPRDRLSSSANEYLKNHDSRMRISGTPNAPVFDATVNARLSTINVSNPASSSGARSNRAMREIGEFRTPVMGSHVTHDGAIADNESHANLHPDRVDALDLANPGRSLSLRSSGVFAATTPRSRPAAYLSPAYDVAASKTNPEPATHIGHSPHFGPVARPRCTNYGQYGLKFVAAVPSLLKATYGGNLLQRHFRS